MLISKLEFIQDKTNNKIPNRLLSIIAVLLIYVAIGFPVKGGTDSVFLLDTEVNSSTNTIIDTISVKDTTENNISTIIKTNNINKNIGSFLYYDKNITAADIVFINYYSLVDIISNKSLVYSLSTGVHGNSEAVSFLGASPFANKLSLSGTPLINLLYGAANFNAFSPEFSTNIELLYGVNAAVRSGASGIAVNMQTPIYNTSKPYTSIWFNQGDNNHIGVDGVFSQNFLPNWNLTAGFRSMFSDGSYTNSNIKSWNARLSIRNNISDYSNISLNYNFVNYYSGDFGGVDFKLYNSNSNTPSLVQSNFSSLFSRQYRNNLALNFAHTSKDSILNFVASLYFINEENNISWKGEPELLKIDTSGINTTSAQQVGINTILNYLFTQNFCLDIGAGVGYTNLPETILSSKMASQNAHIFIILNRLHNVLTYQIGGRYESIMTKNIFSFGGKLSLNINNINLVSIDLSSSKTTPLNIFNYRSERHILGIISYKNILYKNTPEDIILTSKFNYELNFFYRNIKDPILLDFESNKIKSFTPVLDIIPDKNIFGLAALFSFNIFQNINIETKIQSSYDRNLDVLPITYLAFKTSYIYTKNASNFIIGTELATHINKFSLYYNPIFKSYSQSDLKNEFNFNGASIFVSAKLGNAFIRATISNLLGLNYSHLAYYPFQTREFSLSLNWVLL